MCTGTGFTFPQFIYSDQEHWFLSSEGSSGTFMVTSMNVLGVTEIILIVTSFLGCYEAAIPLFKSCVMNMNNLENMIDEYRFDYLEELYDAFYEW